MGCLTSKPSYIAASTGSLVDYQKRYLETKTLGQGEFGVVKLVHDVTDQDLINSRPLAVKYLRKGFTFKDNTLYSPIKKEALVGEVEILRRLNGECFNLKLVAVYETSSLILMVTEFCEGGDMIPYVTNTFKTAPGVDGGLRSEDVSRISFQLWSAIDHCARRGVIHRDIKPDNIMFCTTKRDSELRLIDYGSGTLDGEVGGGGVSAKSDGTDTERHHTFAGSAFYISPEMFQKSYTHKTDVWSAGVSLYVLVAGYPADCLQATFNNLQSDKQNRLGTLPNMPENMPYSFHEMLEGALVYSPKSRSSAGQLLKGEFAQFHMTHGADRDLEGFRQNKPGESTAPVVSTEASPSKMSMPSPIAKTQSVLLGDSVNRHTSYLGYQKFERSVTTVLATMLPKNSCKNLVTMLRNYGEEAVNSLDGSVVDKVNKESTGLKNVDAHSFMGNKLQVISIEKLIDVIKFLGIDESSTVIRTIESLDSFEAYKNHAYHISLLRQFVSYSRSRGDKTLDESQSSDKSSVAARMSVHGGNVWNSFKNKKGLESSGHGNDMDDNDSARVSGMRRINSTVNMRNTVHH